MFAKFEKRFKLMKRSNTAIGLFTPMGIGFNLARAKVIQIAEK